MTLTAEPQTGRDRPLLVSIVLVGVLVALAVTAIALGSRTVDLDPQSPEGTVQRYVQAILDEDLESAVGFLTDHDCTTWDYYFERNVRVTLGAVEVNGTRATVDVTMSHRSGEPVLDPTQYSERGTFHLTLTEDTWTIDRAPWPFWVCSERPTP